LFRALRGGRRCAIHGYRVPELDAAATQQLGKMAHGLK
jgi:adenosylmethionine-8-amino-7-oxononanoate aminotransferase